MPAVGKTEEALELFHSVVEADVDEENAEDVEEKVFALQKLSDLEASVTEENPKLTKFDTSIFTGEYVVPPAADYFEQIEKLRSDDAKADKAWKDSTEADELDIYNI